MRDLVAQVTSSLLRFPEVTVEALGEDEVTLDSVLHGRFTTGRGGLAWLSCGPQLEVVHAVTGERLSAYRFTGMAEHPPTVLAVRDFSWLKRCGLLVGLEEEEGSMLCLYDLGISRVVKAVVIPGRITGIEPLVSYGGASASTQHLHQSLRWFFGVAAVVTDIGHVLLVDLCLDDLSCTQTELEASDLEVVNKSPSEIPRLREGVTQQGRHLCLQLSSPSGTAATSLQYVPRTNHLAVGFSDGYLQLWNMKTLKKEYHSQLEGGRVPVYAFTFQEPENDPRNCCYLWAVQSAQDHEGDIVSLHLLQLAFGERKCLASGKILYEGLEYCEERYSQDLNGTVYPLRAHATNTRLLSCQTIEKYRQHPDREDSMSEVASPDTSVSIFSWQVKSYGQGQPSTFIGIFDINRWYHAQMPDSLRAGESLRNCPYLAVWSLDSVVEMTAPCPLLDVVVHDRSLSRGLAYTCPPPEQFFSPTTYNFDASCLLNSGIVHLTCAGYQKETLGYLKKSVPSLSDGISSGYSRCLMSGLLSSRLADVQPSSLSQEEQLDAILMAAVETSSLGMITGCIKQWTTDELPGSAGNLRYILEWAWDRVVRTKEELDRICAPLFDSSSNFTDPQTLQLLQHSQRLLCNISTIFHCMLNEAQELTQRGLVDLMNKSLVSSLISQYAQVVLWFCRTGLLPEVSDDVLQISRPFYSFSVIKNYYIGQREELKRLAKEKWCADCLMIDGLVTQCGERLADLWKRDEGGTGQYPPPSLHALLDLYLLENVDESAKHAIVIYLLLDVMYSFPNKSGASVESFPTAFAIPVGLVKLVQGLWLLDHHDHESSLELLLHPTTSHSLWPWQHGRVLQALMCQGKHNIALRYLHVMKPSMSSTNQAKLCLSVLLHNRCIVEGLALLRQHANKLNVEELMQFLYETCQDLDLMKELLRLPLGPSEQECLERFLQGTGGFQNRELLMVHYLQQANYVPALQINQTLKMNQAADRDPKMKERSNTRNSILSQYGKVLPRAQRKLAIERAKPYHHTTILREVTRPQPLSTVAKRSATETVLTRAAFIKSVLSKIEEVWVGKDSPSESSSLRSPRELELSEGGPHPPTLHVPEAFIGTPINMLTSRVSRLLDLVVQPSLQTSPEIHTQGTSHRPITAWASPKGITKAPELSLLQTPQVVKRARALASSGPVFTSFTPQSILRSSLRPTPVATPSVSPGRSVTPPLRPKESRITFIEETGSPDLHKSSVHWSNGLAASSEITPLKRPPRPPEGGFKAWSEHAGEEPSLTLMPSLKEKGKPEKTGSQGSFFLGEILAEEPKQILPTLLHRHSLGHETSAGSINSDTTLEFHNALSPGDLVRQALELSAENSVDAEVIVGLPRTAESAKPSADGATEELPAASHPAEEQEPIADEKMNSEEECTGKAHEHSPEVERQMHTNEDELQLDKDITLEEGHEQHMAEEFVPLLQVEESDSPSVAAVVLNHNPEVIAVSTHDQAKKKKLELAKEVELAALESIAKEPIAEPSEEPNPAPAQAVTEASIRNESSPERAPKELKSTSQEPNREPTIMPEEPISESPATDLGNHEPRDDGTHHDIAETPQTSEELKHELETSDLDDFVERHLFDNDLSPPLTRSGIKEQSEIWASFNRNSVCESEPVAVDAPAPDTHTSVTSSEAATSESHSVVSLNSEELSSSESDESGAEENEEEEDSGSEVEIIEEVEGNSRQQLPPTPVLYLQDLPHDEQYLQEQSAAVLSLVAPHTQLKVMDGVVEEEEGEVVVVGLEPANLGEEADGPVCYTELKPSTTLLVPLELAGDHQELLAGGALQALGGKLEEALPGSCNTFSLMLDADGGGGGGDDDEEEEEPVASEPNPEHPLIHQNTKQPEDVESPPVAKTDVPSLEPVGQVPDDQLMEELPSAKFEDVSLGVPCAANADKPAKGPHPEERQPEQMKVDQLHTTAFEPPVERVPCVHLDDRREEADSSAPLSHKEVVDERKAAGETLYKSPMPHREVKLEDGDLPKANKDVVFVAEDLVSAASTVQSSASWDAEFKSFKTSKACESPSKDALSNAETNKEETVAKVKQTELVDSMVPSTPRRVTRSRMQLQDSQVPVTPRRSARKVDLELQNEEEILSTKASKPSASARRTPQKATRRKSSLRSRTTNVAGEVQPVEALLINDMIMPQTRQSARKKPRVSNSPDSEAPVDGDAVPLAGPPPSPSRVTRKSRRGFSLALESFQQEAVEGTVVLQPPVATPTRNKRKTRGSTVEKANITLVVDDAQLQNVSRRLTRSQLWNHEKEPEREPTPVLGTPLHTESVNPLANALMERLKHEGAKKESIAAVTEIARAKRRTTKSAVSSAESNSQNVGVEGSQELESTEIQGTMKRSTASVRRTRASKVHKPDISLDGDSLVFSSSLQRTKGRKKESTVKVDSAVLDALSPPVTRTRHAASVTDRVEDKIPPDVATEVEKIKMRKRATRTKVSSKPAPPIEIDLLSPLASPAEAVTRTLKREEEKDVPTLKMNLRRKRVMEGIFPRPVTRRKKL
ncbi:protein ELYS [Electrophorus electricus]|uniref:protein ELYS n=1 Tax=Electrophorus electricus TaxID=8005 RepID=UPI0015D06325|nr:protein ELYS [Electrophorus electricus]